MLKPSNSWYTRAHPATCARLGKTKAPNAVCPNPPEWLVANFYEEPTWHYDPHIPHSPWRSWCMNGQVAKKKHGPMGHMWPAKTSKMRTTIMDIDSPKRYKLDLSRQKTGSLSTTMPHVRQVFTRVFHCWKSTCSMWLSRGSPAWTVGLRIENQAAGCPKTRQVPSPSTSENSKNSWFYDILWPRFGEFKCSGCRSYTVLILLGSFKISHRWPFMVRSQTLRKGPCLAGA